MMFQNVLIYRVPAVMSIIFHEGRQLRVHCFVFEMIVQQVDTTHDSFQA